MPFDYTLDRFLGELHDAQEGDRRLRSFFLSEQKTVSDLDERSARRATLISALEAYRGNGKTTAA